MATNPYLPAMGEAITNQVTNNLNRNILPTMRRGAVASGGWGNSGQGIAQGLAVGETNQGLSNSLSNLYGQSWNADQDRANQMGIASLNASTQKSIAELNDATNRYGLGNQFTLGLGNLGLGYGQLGQQRRQGDQSYSLGLGNLGNQAYANDTSRIGTVGGLQNQRYGMDQNYSLGMGNLGVAQQQANTQRELGLGGLENQRLGLNQNYDLGLGGLANQRTGLDQNFYSQQRQQDLSAQAQGQNQYLDALRAQLGIGQAQTQVGNDQYNAYLNPVQAFGSGLNPFTGLNSTQSTTTPSTGGGIAGAAGGALTAAQLWKLLNGGP